ncbi:hypothetical protein [Actinoplanes siamensis]|uniref:Uncharacterized protein n=1 Tax=Actinoplanes siamensis TaxID=1223317 RepID=A0A919NCU9_9ACTN|nr:hypothetical protein [Actinoplanes siamensis]GIF08869.1 hypothetical protein Asi03nite_64070 [Actinoplanes siamensis]
MTDPTTSARTAIPAGAVDQLLAEADDLLRRVRPVARLAPGAGDEYRADIHTSPVDGPAAVVWFRAASIAAAVAQTRAHLTVQPGPDDRYAELYVRTGDLADHLVDVHLGA